MEEQETLQPLDVLCIQTRVIWNNDLERDTRQENFQRKTKVIVYLFILLIEPVNKT